MKAFLLLVLIIILVAGTSILGQAESQQSIHAEQTTIVNVINDYQRVKYESRLDGKPIDFSHLFLESEIGQSSLEYQSGLLELALAVRNYYGTLFEWYEYHPRYSSVTVHGQHAEVIMYPEVTYGTETGYSGRMGSEQHKITLTKMRGDWFIEADLYTTVATKAYRPGTNFGKKIRTFAENAVAKQNGPEVVDPVARARLSQENDDLGILTYLGYDREKARWYAYTYTDNTGGESTAYYNDNFEDWVGDGGDCQNFASQAVWYGFDGTNDSEWINNHRLPMIDNWSGAADWWCDIDNATNSWVNVTGFRNMVFDNFENDKVGVQGLETSADYVQVADIVNTPGHATIVQEFVENRPDGHWTLDEIYVSSHTANYKSVPITEFEVDMADVIFIRIYRHKR